MLLLFVYEQFGEREKVEENISVHLIVLTFWVFALNSLTVDKILYCSLCSINFYCLVLNECPVFRNVHLRGRGSFGTLFARCSDEVSR